MIPSENYEDLTPVHGQEYTAPADGWYSMANSNGDTSLALVVNGVDILRNWTGNYSGVIMPVYKGAKVRCEFYRTPLWFRFVYARGSTEQIACIKY